MGPRLREYEQSDPVCARQVIPISRARRDRRPSSAIRWLGLVGVTCALGTGLALAILRALGWI